MTARTGIALLIGLIGFALYLAGVVAFADRVRGLHWALEALYFAVAGVLWVLPARALIFWAAGRR
ncbi:hypothetical protein GCM10010964_17380 [Caldovatus sediminis]|jgi:hypothetical protein|uniref:DUF2842 domain-containing protein n=1 Tax=Caldovatus sediminis TaxID=2041189 RepID=A0A8J2ZBA7_9PROT|nr:DUF2842 domain-containing protein [Caldovatus sediminis]GGG29968.1 hypothetical protein GCM10010964_17380 [Caldovatus sediminis]